MPDTPLNPAVVWNLRALADEGTRELRHVVLEPDLLHKLLDIAEAVAQPEVNSVEELDALPIGSVIMPMFHKDKSAILKDGNGDWAVSGHPRPYDTKTVFLVLHGKGARVLYHPEVNDA